MTTITNTITTNYAIPVPSLSNRLIDDLPRLASAITTIDLILAAKLDTTALGSYGAALLNSSYQIKTLNLPAFTGDVFSTGGNATLTLTDSGVAAGTYRSVTVDSKGRVTSGTNPNTLAGYSIIDAVNINKLGATNGVATLDALGRLTISQIPEYTGDVTTNGSALELVDSGVIEGTYTAVTVDSKGRVVTGFNTSGQAGGVATLDGSSRLTTSQVPGFLGDVTNTPGTLTLALSTTGVAAGTYNTVTVDTKGRVTSGTNVVEPSTGTGDVVRANSPTLVSPALGTPASGVLTNCTGYTFANISTKPTTLTGYGITDAIASSLIGAASGIAPLGSDSKIPSTYLPSYVDDVIEATNFAALPATGESGKIYVALDTAKIYRWSGSTYIEIATSVSSADTAVKLATPSSIAASGDASWSVNFDGSANTTATLTLANVVTAGTGTKVTYNAKGLITGSTTLTVSDITNISTTYQALNSNLTTISGLSTSNTGFIKLTNGVASFDNATYAITGGDLGTPSAGVLTNCTGYTYANLTGTVPTWNQNTTGTAAGLSSTLVVASGGTGVTTLTGIVKGNGTSAFTAATADVDFLAPGGNLGTPSAGVLTNCTGYTYANLTGTVPTWNQNTTGTAAGLSSTLAVTSGGTGATTLTGMLKGNGTSAISAATPGVDFLAPGGTLDTPTNGTLTNCTGYTFANLASKPTTLSGYGITDAIASSLIGAANGIVPLGSDSKISSTYLPSYVDDVVEGANLAALPITGESGKIYVAVDTAKIYRWSGSTYIEIATSVSSADTAVKLATARNIAASGDASWAVSFDGSANTTATLTLANVVTAGTGTKVTYNAKGLITGSTTLTVSDITNIATTYQALNANLTTISALSTSTTGFIKLSNGVASFDNATYAVTGGDLGTPSAGVLTNCTGYTYANLTGTTPTWNQNTTGTAAGLSSTLVVGSGGTGVTTLTGIVKGNGTSAFSAAVANVDFVAPSGDLGTPSAGVLTNCTGYVYANLTGTVPTWNQNTTGTAAGLSSTLAVASGGTGATTLTGMIKGNGTSAISAATPGVDFLAPGGTLGTPTNGTLTNCTGYTFANLASKPTTLSGYGITDAVASSLIGAANGIVPLGSDSKISATYLPSYVDDVVEGANLASLPVTGEAGKIYVALDTAKIYRWSGSTYIEIATSVGSADTAVKLTTARSIDASGDASWTVNFDGSANVSATLTLANVVTAGTGTKLTYNAKGLVTGSTTLTVSDITNISTTYQALNTNLTTISGLSTSTTGLIKLTNGVASFDSNSYVISGGALGTPSSGTLTNCTGYTYANLAGTIPTWNQNTTGTAAGLSSTLAVTSGGTGVTTSTGSGSVVLSNSPTLVTPLLGTPTSGVLTNCTGYTFANLASNPTTLSGYGITDAVASSLIGAANGIAPLGSDSKISSTYLPSYVDDVIEAANLASLPATGESGKIYVAADTSKIYRWSGSTYIEIAASVGSADTAVKLATARSIAASGDATWSVNFDGSANASATLTLANVVTAGTGTKLTYNAKGLITGATTLAVSDITDIATYYQAKHANLTTISGLSTSTTGLIKLTNGVASVDSNTYVISGGALGTPSSGTLTNCTGYTYANLSGTVPTWNQNTTGTAAGLSSGGTLGTPSSGTLTNCTGYTYANLAGTIPTWNQNTTGTAAGLSSTLAVASGGTGSTTLTANSVLLGNGTSALQTVAPGSTGNILISNGTTWVSGAAPISLPAQTGNTGKYLTTDGTTASWSTVLALPTQTGNSGKYLTTDGTNASWSTVASGLLSTPVKVADYTASSYELVRVNTTTGAVTVTLPSAPADGSIIGVIDVAKTFGVNAVTVIPGSGKTIEGDSTSMLLNVNGLYASFVYVAATTNWRILQTPLNNDGSGAVRPTDIKTASYTAVSYDLVCTNTTSSAFNVTLPVAPLTGAVVGVMDVTGTYATNNLTVLPGAGATVEGDTSFILDVNNTYASFIYFSDTNNWRIQNTPGGAVLSTGTGSLVNSISPTLVTPLLGTPTSGVLTNCTGYTFANLTSKPTTLSGYGITDAVASSTIGAANGVAPLGSDSKISATYLPSYVDDVLEAANFAALPATGESGKIYIAVDTSKIYRWTGTIYVEIAASVGSADTAVKLATARSIAATGDATWSVNFDGSANASATLTLANVVTAGTGTKLTYNAKGLITGSTTLTVSDITNISTTYQGLNANLTSLAALSTASTGLVKLTNGTASLDTSNYLVSGGALGTPSSGTLTNATGLPISTGISGLGTGIATFLATPSSANLISAITDETGSGALVFGTGPTIDTPKITTELRINNTANTFYTGFKAGTITANKIWTLPTADGTANQIMKTDGAGNLGWSDPTVAAGSNTQLQFNNSGALGASSNLAWDGTYLSATYLKSSNSVGDEGGEILLVKPQTNSTIAGTGVTIDIYQNKLRIFEQGGTARGAYIDLTAAGAGVGSNLLSASAMSYGTGVATWLATPTSANLISAITDETGSGSLVFATSPTLVTPNLGTPSTLTLTNATGLPISTGISGLGTGIATFLATPSSANLISAVTDETGTGSLVFATSPTLVTPNLGTPSTLTLTNATGLPISTGVSGLATGIATFLATPSSANLLAAVTDETGTGALVFATSPTLVTPLLGTPTSGNFSTGTFTWPTFNQSTTGSAATLTTARNISASGDATWTVSFNGSADVTAAITLANVVTAGTGTKLTYNAKGLITGSSTLTVSDISNISTTYQGLNANLTSLAALSTSTTGLVKLTNGTASLDTSSYLVSGGALGTPTGGDLSNATNAIAYGIKTATNTVSVSAATAPSVGQALVATSATTATWQTVGAGGSSLPTQTGNTGKYLTTDGTNASWSVVSGGLTSTAVRTSAYTAVAYDLVRANTTSGSFTVTFPTSPADGAQIGVIDIAKTFGSYPLTLTPGAGTTIEGDATGVLLDINGTFAAFVYTASLTNWRLLNIPTTTNNAYNNGTLYPTNVVTSAYSASSNEIVRCNTSGGAFSVTFPAAPLDGAIIGIVDINNTFAINNLTILPAGKTIEGDVTSYVLDMSSVYVSFIYSSSTDNWRLLETPTASPTASIGKSIAMSIAFGG